MKLLIILVLILFTSLVNAVCQCANSPGGGQINGMYCSCNAPICGNSGFGCNGNGSYICFGVANGCPGGQCCPCGPQCGNCFGTCNCFPGYNGTFCQFPVCNSKWASDPLVCSERGTCVGPNNCKCLSNYMGNDCQVTTCFGILSNQTNVCLSRGNCVSLDTCSCNAGWGASQCQTATCYGKLATDPLTCSGRGTCVAPNSCINCLQGWYGSECQNPFVCYGKSSSTPSSVCSGHGVCIGNNTCACNAGWIGSQCNVPVCYEIMGNTTSVCSGKGTCTAPNTCSCSLGYGGNQCQTTMCFGKLRDDPAVCSNNRGNCTSPNLCTCPSDYNGNECQYYIQPTITCFGKTAANPTVCSSKGSCVGNDRCICSSDKFFGSDCQYAHFYWKASSTTGLWSDLANWLIATTYLPVDATRLPGYNDYPHLDSGSVTVTVDKPLLAFTSIEIGSNGGTGATLILQDNHQFDGNVKVWPDSQIIIPQGSTTTVSGVLDYASSLTIPSRSQISIMGSDVTIETLNNNGIINFTQSMVAWNVSTVLNRGYVAANSITFISNGVINNYANWIQIGDLLGSTTINNLGNMEIRSSWIKNVTISENVNIVNSQMLTFMGNGTITLAAITPRPYSNFSIQNTFVIFTKAFNVTDGYFGATGTIQAPALGITTSTGVVTIPQGVANILGSYYVDQNVTVFYQLTDKEKDVVKLKIRDQLHFYGVLFLKISPEMSVKIGDVFKFVTYGSTTQTTKIEVMLAGAAYKKATLPLYPSLIKSSDLLQQTTPLPESGPLFGDLTVDLSVGNAGFANEYKCHYLGNRKIIEIVKFEKIKKLAVTITTPTVSGWSGFAVAATNRLNDSLLIAVANGGTTFLLKNHYNLTSDRAVLDLSSTTSTSLFSIGALYQSITAFVDIDLLKNAKYVFYAENSGKTYNDHLESPGTHNVDPVYEFDLFNGPYVPCTNFLAPSRIEARHPASIAIILALYVILFILCIVFIRVQPLKSRGLAPTFTILFLTFELGFQTRNFDFIPIEQRSLCLFDAYLLYPLHQVLFWMILLYFIRYYAVISINTLKNNMTQSDSTNSVSRYRSIQIAILKYMNNTWVMLLFALVYIFCSALINTIIIASSRESLGKFLCGFETLSNLRLANSILLFLTLLGVFILVFSDIISNYKLIFTCKLHTYLLKRDPFYFRLQMVFFLPVTVLVVIAELYNFGSLRSFLDMIYLHSGTEILNTIMFALILFVDVVLPLIITIIATMARCCRTKVKTDKIDAILNDPEAFEIFVEYGKYEFAVENMYAWRDITDYRLYYKTPEKYKKIFFKESQEENANNLHESVAMLIVLKYFNGVKSLYESNITASNMKKLQENVAAKSFEETLFDEALKDVRVNLCDTYSRFLSYPPWKHYLASLKLKEELLGKDGGSSLGLFHNVRGNSTSSFNGLKEKVKRSINSLTMKKSKTNTESTENATKKTELEDIPQKSNQNVQGNSGEPEIIE